MHGVCKLYVKRFDAGFRRKRPGLLVLRQASNAGYGRPSANLAALLLGYIPPVCSLVAPCQVCRYRDRNQHSKLGSGSVSLDVAIVVEDFFGRTRREEGAFREYATDEQRRVREKKPTGMVMNGGTDPLVLRQVSNAGSGRDSGKPGKARRGRIPVVCNRGATRPGWPMAGRNRHSKRDGALGARSLPSASAVSNCPEIRSLPSRWSTESVTLPS